MMSVKKVKGKLGTQDAAIAYINGTLSPRDLSLLTDCERKEINRSIKASIKFARKNKDKKTLKTLSKVKTL